MAPPATTTTTTTTTAAAAPSAKTRRTVITKKLRALRRFVFSSKIAPVLKGTIAYALVLSIVMIRGFVDLNPFPPALASMLIMVIAGNVGGPIGATVQSGFLGISGVALGGLAFYALANLHTSRVAQGFVFCIFVYIMAIIKAQGPKWFGFSLLAVLVAFNGVYTSVLLNGYSPAYLRAYLEAYAWGGAINLGINLLVWPRSSEKELRQTLVLSVEHLGTFAHLLAKTYTMTITDEEKKVRDHLAQSLRADFGFLNQKISDTAVEINYSKYSMQDYTNFVIRTRALQVAAISAWSSLVGLEDKDVDLFKRYFLQNTRQTFLVFRKSIDVTLSEIKAALECKPLPNAKAEPGYCEFLDLEGQRPVGSSEDTDDTLASPPTELDTDGLSTQLARAEQDIELQLRLVAQRLESEVNQVQDDEASSAHGASSAQNTPAPGAEKPAAPAATGFGVERIAPTFDKFALVQQNILSELLATGVLHGQDAGLRLHLPQPSIQSRWGGTTSGATTPRVGVPYETSELDRLLGERVEIQIPHEGIEDTETAANHHSLMRVYSFLFAMRIYVKQLELYHRDAVRFRPGPGQKHAQQRLQIHFFQSLRDPRSKSVDRVQVTPPMAKFAGAESEESLDSPADDGHELSFKEAAALLEGRTYVRKRKTLWERIRALERAARSPTSVFAFKTAGGAAVFATLLFAPATRQFFINYSLTGGLLTLIVSISPTLGQSLSTFILQIAGSGLGYLWGVALLEMFRNVGGFVFNPYGIVTLLSISSLPFFYLINYNPKFFVLSLLALNSAGVVVTTEWIYVEYYKRTFDSPIFRAGKAITSLAIALAIAVIFQVFVLRNPARRTLRKTLAKLAFSTLSYFTLFHAYSRIVLPLNRGDKRPPKSAIIRVEKELKHREMKLQQAIIDTNPLLFFAAAEVDSTSPFRADIAAKILKIFQVMLDRLKEARSAIGTEVVPEIITREFSSRLYPYRQRHIRLAKASLYMCASSLTSKGPLPIDTPAKAFMQGTVNDFLHDAMVLSSHVSRTEQGKEAILNGELTRYWSYVMTVTSLSEQLVALEDACIELFGDVDSTLA